MLLYNQSSERRCPKLASFIDPSLIQSRFEVITAPPRCQFGQNMVAKDFTTVEELPYAPTPVVEQKAKE